MSSMSCNTAKYDVVRLDVIINKRDYDHFEARASFITESSLLLIPDYKDGLKKFIEKIKTNNEYFIELLEMGYELVVDPMKSTLKVGDYDFPYQEVIMRSPNPIS